MNEENRWDKSKIPCIVFVVICLVTIWNMNHSIKNMR